MGAIPSSTVQDVRHTMDRSQSIKWLTHTVLHAFFWLRQKSERPPMNLNPGPVCCEENVVVLFCMYWCNLKFTSFYTIYASFNLPQRQYICLKLNWNIYLE